MGFRRDEQGQILVITALSMVVLLGFAGLALDVSLLFRAKRNLQIVADAAATAGALNLSYGYPAYPAAINAAKENGIWNGDGNGDLVTINCGDGSCFSPVMSGYHTGAGYVEAIISQPNPTFFMHLFGFGNVRVVARAVAGFVQDEACLYANNKSGADFTVQGHSTITNPDGGYTCGIYSNSSSSDSVDVTGGSTVIKTTYVSTVGGLAGNQQTGPTPTATDQPVQSPAAAMQVDTPDPSGMSCVGAMGATQNIPGSSAKYPTLTQSDIDNAPLNSYTGPSGETVNGIKCISGNVVLGSVIGTDFYTQQGYSYSTLDLGTGLYAFTGNVVIGSNVTSTAVTLDIYSGSLTVEPTTDVQLIAPTSGTYNGILFLAPSYQAADAETSEQGTCLPPGNTNTFNIQWGAADGTFDGMIDAPCTNISLQDQGGSALVTGLDVGSISMGPGVLLVDNYSAEHPTTSPMHGIALVE